MREKPNRRRKAHFLSQGWEPVVERKSTFRSEKREKFLFPERKIDRFHGSGRRGWKEERPLLPPSIVAESCCLAVPVAAYLRPLLLHVQLQHHARISIAGTVDYQILGSRVDDRRGGEVPCSSHLHEKERERLGPCSAIFRGAVGAIFRPFCIKWSFGHYTGRSRPLAAI